MKTTAAVVVAIIAVLALLYVATAPAAPPEMTEAEIAQIEAEVTATTDALAASWNAYDVEAFMSIFHPEKVSFAWGARVWKDHGALGDEWRTVWETGDSLRVTWTDRTVTVLTDGVAAFQGSTDLTIYYDDGRILNYPGTAHWTGLFEPSTEGWKMTTSAYNWGGGQRLDQEG